MIDPFDLQRFVDAQQGSYDTALAEIRRGQKRSHWMWFVFPQIAGLGSSGMAQRYAIGSLNEAQAYLSHPILAPRLLEIVGALQDLPIMKAVDVFGPIDAVKLRSSLTLFVTAGGPAILSAALGRWFSGELDAATLELVERGYKINVVPNK